MFSLLSQCRVQLLNSSHCSSRPMACRQGVRQALSGGVFGPQLLITQEGQWHRLFSSISRAARSPYASPPPPPFTPPTPEDVARMRIRNALGGLLLIAAAGLSYHGALTKRDSILSAEPNATISNWSGTHVVTAKRLYEPETQQELENMVRLAHKGGQRLRAAGAALSPNGSGLSEETVLSLGRLDRVVEVDAERQTVRVEAGARIADLAAELKPYGLTLANYASIREQTVGGFIQAGSHGTGAHLPPVDAQVVGLKLVTPGEGVLELTREKDNDILRLAGVGLGALGVVAEATIACVPAHKLLETTTVESMAAVRKAHSRRLAEAKHLRYMWIPYTDAVVVVCCDEVASDDDDIKPKQSTYSAAEQAAPLAALALSSGAVSSADEANELSPFDLRARLLGRAPLDPGWVTRVNAAEAEYWRRAAGQRIGWSDEILGFDCGGDQWVSESCFRDGNVAKPNVTNGLSYMNDLLKLIKRQGIPAPAPIEQRWTCGSPAAMSPAAGTPDQLFSWVGIIQYRVPLPGDDIDAAGQKQQIDRNFIEYRKIVHDKVAVKYDARQHWAKIEPPEDPAELEALRAELARQYPLEEFNALRQKLDPKNILANAWLDALIPRHDVAAAKEEESVEQAQG